MMSDQNGHKNVSKGNLTGTCMNMPECIVIANSYQPSYQPRRVTAWAVEYAAKFQLIINN